MPKLPSSKEIIRTLEKHGFEFVSQRGSHAKYRSGERTVIIPTPRKEIPLGPSALSFANLVSLPKISKNRATAPTRYTF